MVCFFDMLIRNSDSNLQNIIEARERKRKRALYHLPPFDLVLHLENKLTLYTSKCYKLTPTKKK